jgi:predicted N-formylglutamate amidohydrolase
MKLSDGAVIPGNQNVDPYGDKAEWQRRIDLFYKPYDAAIKSALEAAKTAGIAPIILSVHSFTPIWRGTKRPWHAGVLWDKDPRLAKLMMSYMAQLPDLVFGDNEPYDGQLIHDTLYRHGTSNGLPHAIIELRQDEIETNAQQDVWAARLVDFLRLAVSQADIATYQYFGSVNDAPNG